MSAFLAFLAGLPSAFWTSLTGFVQTLRDGIAGAVLAKLWEALQQSKRLNEQLNDIIRTEKSRKDVERETAHMSDNDIVDELRRDFGPERRKRVRPY